ncbi:MAG TPA: phosphomannomutase/phosphoglucomutase, partial [Lysobacter sp.]
MNVMEKDQLAASAAQLKSVLPLVIAACALLAAWFGWNGWQLYQDGERRQAIAQVRDDVVLAAQRGLINEQKQLAQRLAAPELQAALAAGDLAAASRQLGQGWAGAADAVVLPIDLSAEYAALPKGGYGRLGVIEAAIASERPTAGVVRHGGGPQLALAAPARSGEQMVGVAYVRLPLQKVSAALEKAAVSDDSYLALRQGGFSAFERGDSTLSGGAEALAVKVPGTDLRVAAAVPDVAGGPFGLDAILCFVAAIVFALLALLAWRAPHFKLARGKVQVSEEGGVQTLAESMEQSPLPEKAPPVVPSKPVAHVQPVAIDRGIFRAYDIRGIVGQSLDAGVAELIGHAVGSLMHDQGLTDIVVGRDGRLSGPTMAEGLIAGLRKAGRNVIDIGMAPTPVVYFGAFQLRAGSCVSVTGSHNPPDYNGFKIVVGGETLSGTAITDLYARIAEDRLHMGDLGNLTQRDISEDYVQRIASDVQIDRPLRIVVDAGNGVAGEIGPRVLSAIGAEVTPLYCDIDGTFPNHHPDPSEPHNLVDLIKMVQRLEADIGIAFDGDGDRLGVVTRDGENIYPDRLLMLFAADVLERNPGAVILYDVKCTGRLPGQILRHGGSPLMWKTGHSLIKAKMKESHAELAGEMSGHIFYKNRFFGFDDAPYTAARLLEILSFEKKNITELLSDVPVTYSSPELRFDTVEEKKFALVERCTEKLRAKGLELITVDGVRATWPDGWGLIRASNTTPILVV